MSFHIIFVTFQQLVDNLPHPPWILHKPDHNRELLWTFELFLRGSSVKVVAMIIYKSGALHCTLAPIAETSLGLFHTEGNRDWKRRSKSKASQKKFVFDRCEWTLRFTFIPFRGHFKSTFYDPFMLTIFSILLENRRFFDDLDNCGWGVWRAIFTSYPALCLLTNLLPPEQVVCGNVMFSVVSVSVIPSVHRGRGPLFKLVHLPPPWTCWQAGGWLSTERPSCYY